MEFSETSMELVRKEMQLMRSINAYDWIMMERIMPNLGFVQTNGNFAKPTKEWYEVLLAIRQAIIQEYNELFNKDKSFAEIYEEYQNLKKVRFAQVEYPKEETQRGI